MRTERKHSLWFRLAGAFVLVTLLTLAIALAVFYLFSQSEMERFLEQNSSAVERIVNQAFPEGAAGQEPIISGPDEEGVVSITVPLENAIRESTTAESSRFIQNLRWGVVVVIAAAAALTLLFSTLLFRQITHPLTDLQQSAFLLGEGDLGVRVPITSQDEVGQVAQAFNQMADQLEEQQRLRRQMIADIAHELRTPLSVMRGNLEAMLDGLIAPEPRELADVQEEVLRLTRLTEDLRLLSLADAGQLPLAMTQVDIGDLLETIIRQMVPQADKRKVHLEGDLGETSAAVTGDPDKLKQVLINLVDNGLRFTPPGGRVLVKTRQSAGAVNIMVIDGGPGIAHADQPYVFERFWRGDAARSRTAGGSGLGLAIVKEIVTLHGGTVKADSEPGEGSTFTITLPV